MWLKAFTWNKGGNLSVTVNDRNTLFSLYSPTEKFKLIKIWDGIPKDSTYEISIKNINGENYLEGIYPKEQMKSITYSEKKKTDKFIVGIEDENYYNLIRNPNFLISDSNLALDPYFIYYNNRHQSVLSSWADFYKNCQDIFRCTSRQNYRVE